MIFLLQIRFYLLVHSSAIYKVVYSLVYLFLYFLLILETLFRFEIKHNCPKQLILSYLYEAVVVLSLLYFKFPF